MSCWIRLKFWKMKPIRWLRISDSCRRPARLMSWPPRMYWPLVGWSRQPRMFISVLLPEPLAPMMAVYSPSTKSRLMRRRAGTSTFVPGLRIDLAEVLHPRDKCHGPDCTDWRGGAR